MSRVKRRIKKRFIFLLLIIIFLIFGFIYNRSNKLEKKYNKSITLIKKNDYYNALEQLDSIENSANLNNKTDTELYINTLYLKADIYKKLDKNEDAIIFYKKGLEEDIKERDFARLISASDYLRRGLAFIEVKEYQNALDCFNNGLDLANIKSTKELLFNKAVCYEYMGEWGKAKNAFEEYLDKFPEDDEAQNEWEFLETR